MAKALVLTIEQAKARAQELVNKYPEAKTVKQLIDTAHMANEFKSNDEVIIVWGRVCRLLPQEVSA